MKINKFKRLNGKNLKIAIVQARFNCEITDGLTAGAEKALKESGIKKDDIKIFKVPGSFEIPFACKQLAGIKKFDGLIAIGAVIKGETSHFEHISRAATDGILKVSLNNNIPISFGVITVENMKQAVARSQDNKNNKGYEAALALIELIIETRSINSLLV